MNVKQLITLSALVFAGSAAMADDITLVNDNFIAQKSRAEVHADLLQARANGTLVQASEGEAAAPAVTPSTLTREQVRAELRNAPKTRFVSINPAA
jgi:hypothetical protein